MFLLCLVSIGLCRTPKSSQIKGFCYIFLKEFLHFCQILYRRPNPKTKWGGNPMKIKAKNYLSQIITLMSNLFLKKINLRLLNSLSLLLIYLNLFRLLFTSIIISTTYRELVLNLCLLLSLSKKFSLSLLFNCSFISLVYLKN
ncbi:MAG: hypothetical protein PWP18_620 [Thermoanaerobacter sp.]|jgi:hypothetical protein|nr:MAG: hypothetical protein XD37_0804 [Thermoanaerobacter thermocopriae]MBZ4656119.1 hypothetical protein [Thermoanaerobacter sp.]MDK2814707.1 hypothetical protein [Thermoanaerobacter sp.]